MGDLGARVAFGNAREVNHINGYNWTLLKADPKQVRARFNIGKADKDLLIHTTGPGYRCINTAEAVSGSHHQQAAFGAVVQLNEKFVDLVVLVATSMSTHRHQCV